jgi:hypothetical protein
MFQGVVAGGKPAELLHVALLADLLLLSLRANDPKQHFFYSLTLRPGYKSGVGCVWVLDTIGARGMSVTNIIGQAAEFPVGFLLLGGAVAVATALLILGIFIFAKHEGKLRG